MQLRIQETDIYLPDGEISQVVTGAAEEILTTEDMLDLGVREWQIITVVFFKAGSAFAIEAYDKIKLIP